MTRMPQLCTNLILAFCLAALATIGPAQPGGVSVHAPLGSRAPNTSAESAFLDDVARATWTVLHPFVRTQKTPEKLKRRGGQPADQAFSPFLGGAPI